MCSLICRKPAQSAALVPIGSKVASTWSATVGVRGLRSACGDGLQRVKITTQPRSVLVFRASYSTRGHEKSKDLYTIIGVSPHATQQQIKEAYYRLSMRYHPDRNRGSPEAHQRFTELTEAYSILGQYDRRRKYDKGLLHQYPRRPHPSQRHDRPTRTAFHGQKVKKFDFDEFYRAHYGEALRRQQQIIREKAAARERAKLHSLSDSTQRLLIVSVTLLVFLIGWYGSVRKKARTSLAGIEN